MSAHRNDNAKACGNCTKFARNHYYPHKGECYHAPPVVHPGGFMTRPEVGEHDRPCSFHVADEVLSMTTEDVKAQSREIVEANVANGNVRLSTAPPAKWAPKGKKGAAP